MTSIRVRGAVAAVSAAIVLASMPAAHATTAVTATVKTGAGVPKPVCAAPAPGMARCLAFVQSAETSPSDKEGATSGLRSTSRAVPLATASPVGYTPADLRSAYNIDSAAATRGSGLTIAIVDAFDDPNAEADLAVYRSQFGLPPCTTANGCFRKLDQTGGTNYPASDASWAQEISLDLDVASAVCANCSLALVESNSANLLDLGIAENTAARLAPAAISNSFSAPEVPGIGLIGLLFFTHPAIPVVAATGDTGFGTGKAVFPADSPFVVAVGGTTLSRAGNARGWTESVWSGSGSGCSTVYSKPGWQHDTGCAKRMTADVAAVGDPATGVAVYDTFGVGGWLKFGGTSVAAPIIAGIFALAHDAWFPAAWPYVHPSALNDVTSGANASPCLAGYQCSGAVGYDGPTGLGTPNGITAF